MRPVGSALGRAWRDPRGRAGALILAAIAAGAAVGPLLLPDPLAQPCVLTCRNLPPSLEHPFGTDDLSRDILARVATGGTTYANPLSLAAAVAVLREIQTPAAFERVAALGARLADGIDAAAARHGLPWRAHRLGGEVQCAHRPVAQHERQRGNCQTWQWR